MGLRRRAAIKAWAESLVAEHGPLVAQVMAPAPPPRVTIRVARSAADPASCAGTQITLDERWFAEHPDDAGAVVHELSHACLGRVRPQRRTTWLVEGIADLTRNAAGLQSGWSYPHYEAGRATAGYQTSAHFLAWVEASSPGSVAALVRHLRRGTYDERDFTADHRSLQQMVQAYEHVHGG